MVMMQGLQTWALTRTEEPLSAPASTSRVRHSQKDASSARKACTTQAVGGLSHSACSPATVPHHTADGKLRAPRYALMVYSLKAQRHGPPAESGGGQRAHRAPGRRGQLGRLVPSLVADG